jgi:hypothetical protein
VKRRRARLTQDMWSDDDAVSIGIQIVTGLEADTGKSHDDPLLAGAIIRRPHRTEPHRKYAEGQVRERFGVAHGTVDHDALPSVGERDGRQLITDQCATQGAASVDHDHSPDAVLYDQFSETRVVLAAANGRNAAAEAGPTAVTLEQGVGHLNEAWVFVAQIASGLFQSFPHAKPLPANSLYRECTPIRTTRTQIVKNS